VNTSWGQWDSFLSARRFRFRRPRGDFLGRDCDGALQDSAWKNRRAPAPGRKGRGIRGLSFMQTPMDGRYPSRGAALPGLEAGSNHLAAMSSHCANTPEIKGNSSRTATPRRSSTIGLRVNTEAVHSFFAANRLMRKARTLVPRRQAAFAACLLKTSSVMTTNFDSCAVPKLVDMATSAASRPRAMTMRPILGWLWRASNVNHLPSR
jgi:hypothetical protein